MPDQRTCSKCGQDIPCDASEGHCPNCLLVLGHSPVGQEIKTIVGDGVVGRDRNLLFGVFAVQMRLIEGDAFLEVAAAWSANPSVNLIQRLIQSGAMTAEDCELVEGIVSATIQRHGGDATHTFQHLGGEAALATQLTTIRTENREQPSQSLGISPLPANLGEVLTGDDLTAVAETPGRYRSDSEYGRGGMGRILLVHDEYLSRDVALKELLPDQSTDPVVVDSDQASQMVSSYAVRFLKEARITAQLEHPSIVPVHEIGRRSNGTLYYTMKLVRGKTLGKALRHAKSPIARLALLSHYRDLCQAIAYAHSRNVIHRDIKPSNVMIGEFGETVVIDWGLAKVLGQTDQYETALAETWNELTDQSFDRLARTTPGARVGTPQYMSPEQAEGRIPDIDQKSDVFALGVLLYEILTGVRPFSGSSAVDLLNNIRLTDHVPVNVVEPSVPKELSSICDRALQKVPENRYLSANDLRDDIDRFLTGAIVQAYQYSPVELARRVYERNQPVIHTALAASVLFIAMGVIAAVNVIRSRNEAVNARDSESIARGQAEASNYVNQIRLANSYLQDHNDDRARELLWATKPELRNWEWGYLMNTAHHELYKIDGNQGHAISHDGRRFALFFRFQPVGVYDAQSGLLIHTLTPPPTEWVRKIRFNPDDSRLMVQTISGRIGIWDTENWELIGELQAHQNAALDATYMPDGRLLTSGRDGTLVIWNEQLEEEPPSLLAEEILVQDIVCSADGARVAAILGENEHRKLQVWEIAGRKPLGTVKLDEDARYVQVSPSVQQAAWASSGIVKLCDLQSFEVIHDLKNLEVGVKGLAYDSTGGRLAVTGSERTLTVWDTATGQKLRSARSNHGVWKPKWSPDDQLICTLPEPYGGHPQIWSSECLRIMNNLGVHTLPTIWYDFFPDSSRVLTSGGDRTTKVWHALTCGSQHFVNRMDEQVVDLIVSADGKRLAIVDLAGVISVVDLTVGDVVMELASDVVTSSSNSKVAIGPDGKLLLSMLDGVVPSVFNTDSNELISTFHKHNSPVQCVTISADGKHFASADSDGLVHVWNPNTAESSAMIMHGDSPTTLLFSHDSSRLVIGDESGKISLYEWELGNRTQSAQEHSSAVAAVKLSSDGQRIATSDREGGLVVWDYRDQELSKNWLRKGHARQPSSLAFLADSQRLASCSSDGVRLWNVSTGDELRNMDRASELCSVIAAVPNADNLISANERIVQRWTPAPWKQISAGTTMQAKFQQYRQNEQIEAQNYSPCVSLKARIMVMPMDRMDKSIANLKDLVISQSDAIQFDSDDPEGIRIVADDQDSLHSIGVAVGDVIQSIAGNKTTSADLALAAIESAIVSIEDVPLSLELIRDGQSRQVNILSHPVTTETVVIRQSRQQAIERYGRFTNALITLLRLRTPDNANDLSRDGGIELSEKLAEQDRDLLRRSGLAPGDVIVSFAGTPVIDIEKLIDDVNELVDRIKSDQLSEFEMEVRRGKFRQRIIKFFVE